MYITAAFLFLCLYFQDKETAYHTHAQGHAFSVEQFSIVDKYIWATSWQNQQNGSGQSDQSLRCQIVEATERTAKTLIRLRGCPGWYWSSLGAHVILLVLLKGGSFFLLTKLTFGSVAVFRYSGRCKVFYVFQKLKYKRVPSKFRKR